MVWQNLKPDVFDVKLAVARLVDHDDRYQLENAAKFRAVNQQGTDSIESLQHTCIVQLALDIPQETLTRPTQTDQGSLRKFL